MDPSPFILDGGLATELEASGFQLQVGTITQTDLLSTITSLITHITLLCLQGDPLWSARILNTNPQAIKDVHYR